MNSKQVLFVAIATIATQLATAPNASAAPTASELLSALGPCSPVQGVGKFKTDESQASSAIQLCRKDKAIWFKADLDIDCDGGSTAACKADAAFLPETSCVASNGKPLDASLLPFFVLPLNSNGFKTSDFGITCGTVGAVIFNGKVEYAILGDRGPRGVIGEASFALAKRLGINPDPNSGGVGSGVTYIVFTGREAVLSSPIEDHARAQALGVKLAEGLLQRPQAPALSVKSNIQAIANEQWKFFGEQTMKNDALVNRGHSEGDEGFWQRIVQYWKEGVGIQGVTTRAQVMSDGNPWSAAYVSYVMKKSGAGDRFVYAPAHATYINAAIKSAKAGDRSAAFIGHKITDYKPKVGDLVCAPRAEAVGNVTYDNAVGRSYKSHCDIVVGVRSAEIDVIGGNVANSVTRNTVKTVGGKVVPGPDRKWFVVIENRLN